MKGLTERLCVQHTVPWQAAARHQELHPQWHDDSNDPSEFYVSGFCKYPPHGLCMPAPVRVTVAKLVRVWSMLRDASKQGPGDHNNHATRTNSLSLTAQKTHLQIRSIPAVFFLYNAYLEHMSVCVSAVGVSSSM